VTSTRRTAAVAAIALSTLVAACGSSGGNGEDGKTADQIVNDAKAALKSATSYHIAGSITNDGETDKFDMKVDSKDTTSGHMDQGGGVAFDFVTTGGTIYLRGKELFAKANPDVADQIGDKWVTATGNSKFADAASTVTAFADSSGLADSLGNTGGPYTKGGTKTVNGQSVVAVKSKDGEMDVALNGKPYPVHLDAGAHGKVDITEYGSHFGIKAPSGAIDVSTLDTSSSSSESSTTKAVVDAVKVRDGVLKVAEGTITTSSGTVKDGWGVPDAVASQLPSDIDVVLQTGTLPGQPAATPHKVVLAALHESSSDIFLVVTLDTSGVCAFGALTGTPPSHGPYTGTLSSGTACTAANAIDKLAS
jgi:hypothetical protein